MTVDLQTYVLEFGKKHRGERIQRVPASYLLWMVNKEAGPFEVAQAELDRRGISLPEIDISGHAVDSASLRIRRTWHENRNPTEGLHSWLARAAKEALDHGLALGDDAYSHLGVKWVIETGSAFPFLKTVIPLKKTPTPPEPDGPPTEPTQRSAAS